MDCFWCHRPSGTFSAAVAHAIADHQQQRIAILESKAGSVSRINFDFTPESVIDKYTIVPNEALRTVALHPRPSVESPQRKTVRKTGDLPDAENSDEVPNKRDNSSQTSKAFSSWRDYAEANLPHWSQT